VVVEIGISPVIDRLHVQYIVGYTMRVDNITGDCAIFTCILCCGLCLTLQLCDGIWSKLLLFSCY